MGFFVNRAIANLFGLHGFERDVFFALNSCEPRTVVRKRVEPKKEEITVEFERGHGFAALWNACCEENRGKIINFKIKE